MNSNMYHLPHKVEETGKKTWEGLQEYCPGSSSAGKKVQFDLQRREIKLAMGNPTIGRHLTAKGGGGKCLADGYFSALAVTKAVAGQVMSDYRKAASNVDAGGGANGIKTLRTATDILRMVQEAHNAGTKLCQPVNGPSNHNASSMGGEECAGNAYSECIAREYGKGKIKKAADGVCGKLSGGRTDGKGKVADLCKNIVQLFVDESFALGPGAEGYVSQL